ncbi:MAG: alpha/beta hydrolase [Candidatus Vogelbacteria bacterium]|nr:alpha/beta hydrolase [Candidatus Vogelbacteria bacterium]
MKRVFIIHGWDGYPAEGWFPWLKQELEKKNFQVVVPAMPEPAEPKIETWLAHLAKVVGQVDNNTFFVGHSIGCQAVLRYLESLSDNQIAGGVALVAGWINRLDGDLSPEELIIAKPWIETPINLSKIKRRAKKFTAIFSDNDKFTRLTEENERIFGDELGAKIVVEHNRGHFSGRDGVTELPNVLEAIN